MVDGQKDNSFRQETEIYTALIILVGTFALLDGDASDVDIIYFELIWGEGEGGGWGVDRRIIGLDKRQKFILH